jgi:hypothetical protein
MKRIRRVVAVLLVAAAMALVAALGTALLAGPSLEASDQDFVPSERLPADSAISFPVDI